MMAAEGALLVVTGVSGAGKSTAVHALEDLGFFCVDNLPAPVVERTIETLAKVGVNRVALGIDVRGRGFLDEAARVIDSLNGGLTPPAVVFLDASDEALLRRFSSTRRPHPLSTTRQSAPPAVIDGIQRERELLAALRARATLVIDTTRLSVWELRRQVIEHFGPSAGTLPRLSVRIVSFGFKFGSPVDADVLFDARFLDNPYFVAELRDLGGTDTAVKNYVLGAEGAREFVQKLVSLLVFAIPRYEREGRSYLTIGVGCTGGRHRSVVVAEELARELNEKLGRRFVAYHRDLERVTQSGPSADPDHSRPEERTVR